MLVKNQNMWQSFSKKPNVNFIIRIWFPTGSREYYNVWILGMFSVLLSFV